LRELAESTRTFDEVCRIILVGLQSCSNLSFLTRTRGPCALIAGIASPLGSFNVARRQFKASVVSSNRERWIEVLRDAIAEHIAMVASVALSAQQASRVDSGLRMRNRKFTRLPNESCLCAARFY